MRNQIVKLFILTFVSVFITLLSTPAHAYIGPGAGFAVAGSFLVLFTAIASAILLLLTWPIRYLVRTIRYRRIRAKQRVKKAVVLGLDGMDYSLTKKMLAEGKLPNFKKLSEKGTFKPLGSTVPPISPVAWSSFQTGTNPGKHNIFDFLTRDLKTYAAKLSSTDIRGPSRMLNIGKLRIPLGSPDIRLLRKGVPFWKTLGDNGIFSSIIRVPITFPAEKFYGVQLSAMCAPDLRGTQGMFSYYTTASKEDGLSTGGERFTVKINGNTVKAELVGPENPMRQSETPLKIPFEVTIIDSDNATLAINGESIPLKKGVYTNWITVKFKAALGVKISGICKFLLIGSKDPFKLYVTPINIDPEKPAMPVSYPAVYSTYLSKKQGRYATLGLAEDSWALNEKLISDTDFVNQCLDLDQEREEMFFDSLDKVKHGLCVCVFDGTDRVQHAFWREMDKTHPSHEGKYHAPDNLQIEEVYKRADELLGKTVKKLNDKDTLLMIISDHGFNVFSYGVDLNRWLEENGYLKLKKDGRNKQNLSGVDWSETRAFAIGLSGLFLNLKGREAKGIVDPKKEATLLRKEIAEKLTTLHDPKRNQPAVKQVYNTQKIYKGPFKKDAPDLIVGYHIGYRASWETAVGQVTDQIFHDNVKAWSGDHCIDQSLVPGVLFSNRKIGDDHPRLMDIGPTVLDMFGVKVPQNMDGKPLAVAGKNGHMGN